MVWFGSVWDCCPYFPTQSMPSVFLIHLVRSPVTGYKEKWCEEHPEDLGFRYEKGLTCRDLGTKMWGPKKVALEFPALWHLWVALHCRRMELNRYRQSRWTCWLVPLNYTCSILFEWYVAISEFCQPHMHNWCHMWDMTACFRISERKTFPHLLLDMATSLEQNIFLPNNTPISKSRNPKEICGRKIHSKTVRSL